MIDHFRNKGEELKGVGEGFTKDFKGVPAVAQEGKDLGPRLQLQLGLHPWPWNFSMPQVCPGREKRKNMQIKIT